MDICIIGTGYVGLVSGACFAELGNKVICVDKDKEKIASLKKGLIPIYEPGLEDLVKRGVKEKRLSFTFDLKDAVKKSTVIFIAVGTPQKESGEPDLTYVENASRQIASCINGYKLIVEKSTVPVNTGEWVEFTIHMNKQKRHEFDVASNPEFLREGQAIEDFMHPDRIVVGVESEKAKKILTDLYRPLNAPIVVTNIKSAEIIKHASNSFLATKISFINLISEVCDKSGADIVKVAQGMGLDKRIGKSFLDAGIGYGGSCFPKDIAAFIRIIEKAGLDAALLKSVSEINQAQKKLFVKKVESAIWNIKEKQIGVLGLAFKPDTDDMREAPSVDIIEMLQKDGAKVKAYDPEAMKKAKGILKGVKFCKDPYEVASKSEALLILTEWNEFKEMDLKKVKKLMRQPLMIDGRNIYDPREMKALGFRYICIGRGAEK